MPILRNPKHEKFAQLVSSGLTAQNAFTQAGYNASRTPRLRNNELVAKRIEELQARNEKRAERAALSRDELIIFSRRSSMPPVNACQSSGRRWPKGRRAVGQDMRVATSPRLCSIAMFTYR